MERAKRKMNFDHAVARHFFDGLSTRDSAKAIGCTRKRVDASRRWQQLRGAGPGGPSGDLLAEVQLARSKKQRRFDQSVTVHFYDFRTVAESAEILECDVEQVEASRAWLYISTGRNTWRTGRLTGRLTSGAIARLESHGAAAS